MRVEKGAEATVPPGTVPSVATRFHHHHQSKVLLATDGSAEAELAARAAVEQADLTGSELHVVRVGWLPNLLMQDPDIVVGHDSRLYDDSSGWWYNRLTRRL
jgi:hypothetical protein